MNTRFENVHAVDVAVDDGRPDAAVAHDIVWTASLTVIGSAGQILGEETRPLTTTSRADRPDAVAAVIQEVIGREYAIVTDLADFADDIELTGMRVEVRHAG